MKRNIIIEVGPLGLNYFHELLNQEALQFKNKEMINKSGLDFIDISTEKWRKYNFIESSVSIDNPLYLNVSKSGGHRILDAQGISHYIPSGWIHLCWEAKEGQPNFVK